MLQRRVLALQQRPVLERAADAAVELEQTELQRDDADQRECDQPDPHAAANQAVEQAVLGKALERRE